MALPLFLYMVWGLYEHDGRTDAEQGAYGRPAGNLGGGAIDVDDGMHLLVLDLYALGVAHEARSRLHGHMHLLGSY